MSCYFSLLYIQSFTKGFVIPGYDDDKYNNLIN
jgi:hypothetical protein